jgi:hypothetical protein
MKKEKTIDRLSLVRFELENLNDKVDEIRTTHLDIFRMQDKYLKDLFKRIRIIEKKL